MFTSVNEDIVSTIYVTKGLITISYTVILWFLFILMFLINILLKEITLYKTN